MIPYDLFLTDCPARTPLDLIADTWAAVIMVALGHGPTRYSELHHTIGGINKKMQTLRRLGDNDLVERRTLRTAPPGTEYRLTDLGRSLLEPLGALTRWAEDNTGALLRGRTAASV